MKEFKELWFNKNDPKGRIDITLFFTNILLLLVHIFYMFMYIRVNSTIMIYINIFSIFIYSMYIFSAHKNPRAYTGIAMLEIWCHMLLAILSFGWDSSFQNWSFAMITAMFLPIYSNGNIKINSKAAACFTSLLIVSYYLFWIINNLVSFPYAIELSNIDYYIMFIFNNSVTFFSIIMFAIFYTSSSNRRENELSRRADFDELTNIYNRRAMQDIGGKIIYNASLNNKPYHVAILDIDFFKKVNDTYGHLSGDLVLKRLSQMLKNFATKGIVVGRWGGEEFVIICPDTISYNTFTGMLDKFRIKVSKTKFTIEDGDKIEVRISIGAASIEKDITLDEAIAEADERLYKAKETGRNKIVYK